MAQEAQVIPVISSSTLVRERWTCRVVVGRLPLSLERELGGADDAVVLEVEVEAVAAGAGNLRAELDVGARLGLAVAGLAAGVDVQVGEVALAQRDEVSVGAEVGLQVGDRPAVLGHTDRVSIECSPATRSPASVTV